MGIRKDYGKNKKTGRHELLARARHEELVRKAPKSRRRGSRSR